MMSTAKPCLDYITTPNSFIKLEYKSIQLLDFCCNLFGTNCFSTRQQSTVVFTKHMEKGEILNLKNINFVMTIFYILLKELNIKRPKMF